jgi:hypothetical protein
MHALTAAVTTAADERAPRFFKHAWILASPAGGSLTRQVFSEQLQVGFYSGCRKPVPMRGKVFQQLRLQVANRPGPSAALSARPGTAGKHGERPGPGCSGGLGRGVRAWQSKAPVLHGSGPSPRPHRPRRTVRRRRQWARAMPVRRWVFSPRTDGTYQRRS